MDKVKVKKAELHAALVKNRADHAAAYKEALVGFKAKALSELQALLEKVGATEVGKMTDAIIVRLGAPQDHTADYDRTLRMLEMSVEDVIELTCGEFSQFVLDNWQWQRQFLEMSAGYGSSTAMVKQRLVMDDPR